MSDPCPCWSGPVSLHSGHCCFAEALQDVDGRDGLTCDHYEAGMVLLEAHTASQESPC